MARTIMCDLCHDEEAAAMWTSLADGSTIAAGETCAPVFIMGLAQAVGIWPDEPVSSEPTNDVPAESKPKRARKAATQKREAASEDTAEGPPDDTVQSGGHGDTPGRAAHVGGPEPGGMAGTATSPGAGDVGGNSAGVLREPVEFVLCHRCGKPGSWREDPFAADVHNDHSLQALCDDCERESGDSI